MAKINGIMDLGKRSMQNSQTALATVGHNIANRSTEGYSRQRVEIEAAEPIGLGKLRIGQGSKTAAVTRVNNGFLEKQISKERCAQGYFNGLADSMTRVEQVYNEQMNKGLNVFASDFYSAYREFSNNPESIATRSQVVESAKALSGDFKRIHGQLTDISKDIDAQVSANVGEINDITSEIAGLNEKIMVVTASGGPANDERDRRDLLVKRLGEKVNIRFGEGQDGGVTITAGNSALLVSGNENKKLSVQSTPATDTKGEGAYDIYIKNTDQSVPGKVTNQFTGGSLGAALQVRDTTVRGLKDDIDTMAFEFANSVNDLHSTGFDLYGKQAGNFFNAPMDAHNAAANIAVDEDIVLDPGKMASAQQANSIGDNRVANAIADLQFKPTMNNGSNTLDEFYNSMVGKVGVQTKKALTQADNQKNIVGQLNNIRESISGVSLDEETTKLIEFQKSFDASARLIKTADEMFDTVLNLKHM